METCIRESAYVLLVCTPTFAKKANTGRGGVGYEKSIVTGEIFNKTASPRKFIPLLREGNPDDSLPSYLKSKAYIDFRNDDNFADNLESLLRHIYKSPKYVRPPLGKAPSFKRNIVKPKTEITKPSRKFQLADFDRVFKYAYSGAGLSLSKDKAIEWALKKLQNTR